MKVIKPGREQKGWSKEFECTGFGNDGGGCGAILLVEEDDFYFTCSSCRDETDYFTTFCCPCGVETDVKNLPTKIQQNARNRKKTGTADNGEK